MPSVLIEVLANNPWYHTDTPASCKQHADLWPAPFAAAGMRAQLPCFHLGTMRRGQSALHTGPRRPGAGSTRSRRSGGVQDKGKRRYTRFTCASTCPEADCMYGQPACSVLIHPTHAGTCALPPAVHDVPSGLISINVSFAGTQIYEEVDDLCSKTTCPIKTGPLDITYEQDLPPIAPPVRS